MALPADYKMINGTAIVTDGEWTFLYNPSVHKKTAKLIENNKNFCASYKWLKRTEFFGLTTPQKNRKDIGGNPCTLKKRKKALAAKLRNK